MAPIGIIRSVEKFRLLLYNITKGFRLISEAFLVCNSPYYNQKDNFEGGNFMQQVMFWTIATVIFLMIEWPTLGLTTIWFAGGSIVAGVLAVFSCPFPIQFAVFMVVSVALLLFTRPLAIKYLNTNRTRTNVDSLIGKEAVITETINNLKNTGAADIHGVTWTARTDSNLDTIEKDSIVVIERIDGVKLIVKKKEKL